jgi:hypothetical protein
MAWRDEPESCAWRVGSRVRRTIYAVQPNRTYYQTDHDQLIGLMDTSALAVAACIHHNRAIDKWPPVKRDDHGGTREGTEKDWRLPWGILN